MTKATALDVGVTIGIDLGDRVTYACTISTDAGDVIETSSFPTTKAGVRNFFSRRPRSRVVLEVGTHSPWVSRAIAALGHEVFVANARRVQLIGQSDTKTDRIDAQTLARLGRADPELLSPIRHRGEEAQKHLALIRARDAVVAARTKWINHVRGSVKAMGDRLPSCSAEMFDRKVAAHIPGALRPALDPILALIGQATRMVREYDHAVERICESEYKDETTLLRAVEGVGPLTSLAFVLTIEDPHRFKSSRSVGAYLGLRPRCFQSGQSNPQLRITKAGSPYMRRLLVGSAQYILGPLSKEDTALRRFGLALMARGGKNGKKRAVVAVARKLAVVLHHLWRTGEVYAPMRNARPLPAQPVAAVST